MKSKRLRGFAGHGRLEEHVMRWLGNEAQDRDDRPCQNSGLPPRKRHHHLAPLNESLFHFPGAVKEIVETLREGARTSRQLDRIAQRHFLE